MNVLKKCLFFSMILLLTACAKTEVSVMDNTAVGHRNIHIIFINDEFDDPLDAGEYLIDTFLEHGVSASREDPDNHTKQGGSGSGFVVADGYWLTNHHVIDELKKVTVSVVGKDHPAKVIASDKHLDLALLKASTEGLRPFSISQAKVGQDIFAIGYPVPSVLGSQVRITSGIVSSLHGYEGDINNIQISAPIQPGNSGGPIVSKEWKLVGVAVATASTMGTVARTGAIPQGLNFAVSPNHVEGFLLQNGIKAEGPYVSSMEEAIKSSGLIWNGSDAKERKRVYLAKYRYSYYWDMGHHIKKLNIKIVDAETGKTIVTSKTEGNGAGVAIPAEQAAEDILIKLGLAPPKSSS